MREFFRGWKRKVGVATLVMTCGFAMLWIRSRSFTDEILFPMIRTQGASEVAGMLDGLMSTRNAFVWARLPVHHDQIDELGHIFPYWQTDERTTDFDGQEYKRQSGAFGFAVYVADDRDQQAKYLLIPYWSIVIPLTLLSAYLLFSNPRVSQSKRGNGA